MTTRSTPTLDSSSDLGSDPGVLPGFDNISQFTRTPEAYHYGGDVMIGGEDEMLHSPKSGDLGVRYPQARNPYLERHCRLKVWRYATW